MFEVKCVKLLSSSSSAWNCKVNWAVDGCHDARGLWDILVSRHTVQYGIIVIEQFTDC